MKMYDMASRMAFFLAREVGLEQARVDNVRFGLEIIMGEIIKWAILLSVAVALGVLPGVLFTMISTALIRLVSGGAHCEDYWRCLVFGLLVFLGTAKIGVYAAPFLSRTNLLAIIVAGLLIIAVLTLIWAPGEVPNRKIKEGERGFFKGLALAFITVWAFVTVFIILPYNASVAMAGLLGTIVQALSFSPFGFRLIDRFDITLSKIVGERRCPNHAENA